MPVLRIAHAPRVDGQHTHQQHVRILPGPHFGVHPTLRRDAAPIRLLRLEARRLGLPSGCTVGLTQEHIAIRLWTIHGAADKIPQAGLEQLSNTAVRWLTERIGVQAKSLATTVQSCERDNEFGRP